MRFKKKSTKKQLIAVLLVLVMALSCIPIGSLSQGRSADKDIIPNGSVFDAQAAERVNQPVQLAKDINEEETPQLSSFSTDAAEGGNDEVERQEAKKETVSGADEGEAIDSDSNLSESSNMNLDNKSSNETSDNVTDSRIIDDGEPRISEIIAEDLPQNEEIVDFIIVLDKAPLLDVFSADDVKAGTDVVSGYRHEQLQMIRSLEASLKAAYGDEEGFQLGFDYTVSMTGISVKTKYGNKEAIEQMEYDVYEFFEDNDLDCIPVTIVLNKATGAFIYAEFENVDGEKAFIDLGVNPEKSDAWIFGIEADGEDHEIVLNKKFSGNNADISFEIDGDEMFAIEIKKGRITVEANGDEILSGSCKFSKNSFELTVEELNGEKTQPAVTIALDTKAAPKAPAYKDILSMSMKEFEKLGQTVQNNMMRSMGGMGMMY